MNNLIFDLFESYRYEIDELAVYSLIALIIIVLYRGIKKGSARKIYSYMAIVCFALFIISGIFTGLPYKEYFDLRRSFNNGNYVIIEGVIHKKRRDRDNFFFLLSGDDVKYVMPKIFNSQYEDIYKRIETEREYKILLVDNMLIRIEKID